MLCIQTLRGLVLISNCVHLINSGIMSCLINQDQDHEVKECSISFMGLVSTFGDHVNEELLACLLVLIDQTGKEIFRFTAIKHSLLCCFSALSGSVMCSRTCNSRVDCIATKS